MISPVWSVPEGSLGDASLAEYSVYVCLHYYISSPNLSKYPLHAQSAWQQNYTHNNSLSVSGACACTHPTDTVSPSSRLRASLEKAIVS